MPDKPSDKNQGNLITPPTTQSRKRQRVNDAQDLFDDVIESPTFRRSSHLPEVESYEEVYGLPPLPQHLRSFQDRLQEDPPLVDLTGHDAEIAAQLQSTLPILPRSAIPRQDEGIDAQQHSGSPQGAWSRLRSGMDSMLRGTNRPPLQQFQQARTEVLSPAVNPLQSRRHQQAQVPAKPPTSQATNPLQSRRNQQAQVPAEPPTSQAANPDRPRHGLETSQSRNALQEFNARLSRTARAEQNQQAENAQQQQSEHASQQATLYEPGPDQLQLGDEHWIPPVEGTDVLPPGPWATLILKTPFSVAVIGIDFKSELIRALRGLPAQQELTVRWGRSVVLSGPALYQRIGSELANVEAATIQVVGVVQYGLNQCQSCRHNLGLFAHCVKVEGNDACGNCHYQRNGNRCSFSAIVAPNRRRKKITMPFVEFHNLVDRMLALLEHLKALKAEVRGIEAKCAGAANQSPEAELEPSHPNRIQQRALPLYMSLTPYPGRFFCKVCPFTGGDTSAPNRWGGWQASGCHTCMHVNIIVIAIQCK